VPNGCIDDSQNVCFGTFNPRGVEVENVGDGENPFSWVYEDVAITDLVVPLWDDDHDLNVADIVLYDETGNLVFSYEIPTIVQNLIVESGKKYLIVDGLQEGSLTYIDREFRYANVPPELVGALYIQTSADDKFRTDDPFLNFDVTEPVSIFVAYDDRYEERPAWLSAPMFAETDMEINSNIDGDSEINFRLYRNDVQPGRVSLGGNYPPNETGNYGMYGVIIAEPSAVLTCTGFETLPLGAQYSVVVNQQPQPPHIVQPGPPVNVAPGVQMIPNDFQWSNALWAGEQGFPGVATVENTGQAGGTGQEMGVNNINLLFEFDHDLEFVSLRFGEYGGNLNFSVNGDFVNFGTFQDIANTTIGGVNVTIVQTQGSPLGVLSLDGPIKNFAIGGQELWIDDVCYR
jgi:hypothetical protein